MIWFTPTPFKYNRLKTVDVKIGNLSMGSNSPVRVQSMANTSTHDVSASVQQAIEIIDAGGELVRFTVINTKDAEALKYIKEDLVANGYNAPIVADVHFNPELADIAAKYIDKVRINPGNYLDKRATFTQVNFTDTEYKQELSKLKVRFEEFLDICIKNSTAIRIGTNHGSLSDRIMSRYGDSPQGMVEATMEFLRICISNNFNNVVVSLKSSNTRVMVYAYRLLAQAMQNEDMNFALHLGVTEAGSGEDGRIKSAVGIGTLMHDGLGDTIRVSLTEHPAKEIPVTRTLVSHFSKLKGHDEIVCQKPIFNPYDYKKLTTKPNFDKAVIIADLASDSDITEQTIIDLGFIFDSESNSYKRTDLSPDALFIGEHMLSYYFTDTQLIVDNKYWDQQPNTYPLFTLDEYLIADLKSREQNWVQINNSQLSDNIVEVIKNDPTIVLVCFSYHKNSTQDVRSLINTLLTNNIDSPIIIQKSFSEINNDDFQLKSAADTGLFFIDGLANGLWLKNTFKANNKQITDTAFAILQAARTRVTKTEYISCPGCGRTLFDLEKSLADIKNATSDLKGLKIAVMGCIVNGPGEMADADYGYVGAGPGKVSLYKGKQVVIKNIDTKDAVKELLQFIENDNT